MASGRPGDHHPCDLEPEFVPARMESVDANKLFEMALGVGNGWQVVKSEMDVEGRPLQLWLERRTLPPRREHHPSLVRQSAARPP